MGGTPSTNSIETASYQLRKVTKNRGHFPSDEAVVKLPKAGDLRHLWTNEPENVTRRKDCHHPSAKPRADSSKDRSPPTRYKALAQPRHRLPRPIRTPPIDPAYTETLTGSLYPVIYLDAIMIKVRDGAHVTNKAAHIAVGVDMDGIKHVLGIWVQASEGARFWAQVCAELANRGIKDVLIVEGAPPARERSTRGNVTG